MREKTYFIFMGTLKREHKPDLHPFIFDLFFFSCLKNSLTSSYIFHSFFVYKCGYLQVPRKVYNNVKENNPSQNVKNAIFVSDYKIPKHSFTSPETRFAVQNRLF
jgi:hypothetical protein